MELEDRTRCGRRANRTRRGDCGTRAGVAGPNIPVDDPATGYEAGGRSAPEELLARAGEALPSGIIETADHFGIDWDAAHHLDRDTMVVVEKAGRAGRLSDRGDPETIARLRV